MIAGLKSAYEQKEAFKGFVTYLQMAVLGGQQSVDYLEQIRKGVFDEY